jgi:carbon monoxide dehydrogenase subunit G
METKFESRVGKINASDEHVFAFLTDFNNFRQFIPSGKIENFEASRDHCKFSIPGMGNIGFRIVEKDPFKTVKISGEGMANQQFFFWIQLKQIATAETHIKLTIKADLNPMVKMMVSKPLQNFLDKLVEAIEKIPF